MLVRARPMATDATHGDLDAEGPQILDQLPVVEIAATRCVADPGGEAQPHQAPDRIGPQTASGHVSDESIARSHAIGRAARDEKPVGRLGDPQIQRS